MKHALTFILLMLCTAVVSAQYCGHSGNPSGSGQCTPTGLNKPLFMDDDSLLPLINGENSTAIIQFQNADTVYIGGQIITIQSLRIDSVGNLPDGLCWTTNRTNNTVGTGEAGCIKINGTACDLPGQYKLKLIYTVSVGVPIQEVPEVEFLLRLKNMGEADTPIDTNQTFSNPFIPYGNPATGCITSLTEATNAITSLSIFPNPLL